MSRDIRWHGWLEKYANDLCIELKEHLKISKSCKSNREKMIEIRNTLNKRGLDKELFNFLKAFYPTVLQPIQSNENKKSEPVKVSSADELNKHGIFKYFNPALLTFPHKFIIADNNSENLSERVRNFVKNKINFDYVIVDDRAYIEYFEPKYEKEAAKVTNDMMEIYQFKAKHNLLGKFVLENK